MKTNEVGMAGEVRYVITGADGTIKTDSGFHRNLILNQGLDFFGGGRGDNINSYCAIGSGNSTPLVTQTKLDSYISQVTSSNTTSEFSYVDLGDNIHRMWEQRKYRFTPSSDINISELGLVSSGTTSSNYYLTTRTLLKDSLGAPTTITVRQGETLDIYYKIHKVVDTSDKANVINVLDGDGGAVPYNVVTRPFGVGSSSINITEEMVLPNNFIGCSESELYGIKDTTLPREVGTSSGKFTLSRYTVGSFKRVLTFAIGLNDFNGNIRQVNTVQVRYFRFFPIQMRLGRVSDDAPLTKTQKETLSIPLEISWGRYDGEL